MTHALTFGQLQVRHFRRRPMTACGLRLSDLLPTDGTRFPDRVTCPDCLTAMEAAR